MIILNHFTHLIVNAGAYFSAALIIRQEEVKVSESLKELRKSEQPFTTSLPLCLFKPRDHLFAISVELLGKSIINEYEKVKNPNDVPDIKKEYGHKLTKIYNGARDRLTSLSLKNEADIINEDVLLSKLTDILLWASRYHYDGKPEIHIKRITYKSGIGIDNSAANIVLSNEEIEDSIALFKKYWHLHKSLLEKLYAK